MSPHPGVTRIMALTLICICLISIFSPSSLPLLSPPSVSVVDVRYFNKFLLTFRWMHPCPHCREHLTTKVSLDDATSYDPTIPFHGHAWRTTTRDETTGIIKSIWLGSCEFRQ